MSLSLNGIRAWALILIARGETTGDLHMDAHGYYTAIPAAECMAIAEAAIRGDEETVTAKVPSGMSRENIEAICRTQV